MRKVTVLGGAAGTSLSDVGRRLHELPSIHVEDVEYILLNDVVEWVNFHSPGDEYRNMNTVCSQATRAEVIGYWEAAFSIAVDRLSAVPLEHTAVLVTHLTLFSASRLEFYATPLLRSLDRSTQIEVRQVVVLIDDIYDMFERLSGSLDLYGESDIALGEHVSHTKRLTGALGDNETTIPGEVAVEEDLSPSELASLEIELNVGILMRLLQWRRSEMLGCEELARHFSCRFTVFGVKHEFGALQMLLEDESAVTAYISHKITEPRIENLRQDALGRPGVWPQLTTDLNAVAGGLRQHRVVVVQPTAIDELRFTKNLGNSARLDRYSGRLSERWPVPAAAVSKVASDASPRYEHMIDRARTDHDSYRQGLFGLFQHTIYDEIAFRDHLLVSCNERLLVFRPTALGAYVSGGVEEEIGHWANSLAFSPSTHVAAFVHYINELYGALKKARLDEGPTLSFNARQAVTQSLDGIFSAVDIDQIWTVCVERGTPIDRVIPQLTSHLGRIPSQAQDRIELAMGQAIAVLVSTACKVPGSAVAHATHFLSASEADCLNDALLSRIAAYFHNPTSNAIEAENQRYVGELVDFAGAGSRVEFIRMMSGFAEMAR